MPKLMQLINSFLRMGDFLKVQPHTSQVAPLFTILATEKQFQEGARRLYSIESAESAEFSTRINV